MKVELLVSDTELNAAAAAVERRVELAREAGLRAMRDRFYDIVSANFGIAGPERPWAWEPLSPRYARKVGRPYATLFVTGALKASIMKGGTFGESTTVSMANSSVPYVTAHHDGSPSGNRSHPGLPARRVFPLDDNDQVTEWARSEVVAAAEAELRRALS